MKKLLSIGVLFVFLFLMAGQFITYGLLLDGNRQSVLQSLRTSDPSSLQKIVLHASEAKALLDGDEMNYHGNRYDIVRQEVQGDMIVFYVLNDTKEAQLMDALNSNCDNLTGNLPAKPGHNHNPLEDFFKEYTPCVTDISCISPELSFNICPGYQPKIQLLKGFDNLLIPPPKNKIS